MKKFNEFNEWRQSSTDDSSIIYNYGNYKSEYGDKPEPPKKEGKFDYERTELTSSDNNFYEIMDMDKLPKGIKILRCSNSDLDRLPELPDSLEELYCYNNNLKTLPKLPKSLKILKCSTNKLSDLPELPNLKILDISYNNFGNLSTGDLSGLPESLVTFSCEHNMIQTIEIKHLKNLETLQCKSNRIWDFVDNSESLSKFPESLVEIDCSDNGLDYLPELPNSLRRLYCRANGLEELPNLKYLRDLDCSDNVISELPELPKSLRTLSCDTNGLDYLPELPKDISGVSCKNNNMTYSNLSQYQEWYKTNKELILKLGNKGATEQLNALKGAEKYNM